MNIKFNENVFYAIDTKGVAIINKEDSSHFFFTFPEAAVFSILVENNDIEKSNKMLQAVLDWKEPETSQYIDNIMSKWKGQNIIKCNG